MPPARSLIENHCIKITCLISAKCAEIKQTEPFAVRLATTGKAPSLDFSDILFDVSNIKEEYLD
jgi:hypothetical protein